MSTMAASAFLPSDLKDPAFEALTSGTVEAAGLQLCKTNINMWISHFEMIACVCFTDGFTSGLWITCTIWRLWASITVSFSFCLTLVWSVKSLEKKTGFWRAFLHPSISVRIRLRDRTDLVLQDVHVIVGSWGILIRGFSEVGCQCLHVEPEVLGIRVTLGRITG